MDFEYSDFQGIHSVFLMIPAVILKVSNVIFKVPDVFLKVLVMIFNDVFKIKKMPSYRESFELKPLALSTTYTCNHPHCSAGIFYNSIFSETLMTSNTLRVLYS